MKPVLHSPSEPEVISRIIDLLIQQGKSQTDLLNYLGLNRNNFTEWKARRNRSYLMYIDEIARFFDVSPTYLLRGEEASMPLPQQEQRTQSEQCLQSKQQSDQLTEHEVILLRAYRVLSNDVKSKVLDAVIALAENANGVDDG